MDISSESDDGIEVFYHWNNWQCPRKQTEVSTDNNSFAKSFCRVNAIKKHTGLWIPPKQFGKYRLSDRKKEIDDSHAEPGSSSAVNEKNIAQDTLLPSIQCNMDWGHRLSVSCNFGDFDDGSETWTFMYPGMFGTFKMSVNHYGNIVCRAETELISPGEGENAFIVLNTPGHLRKLLDVPSDEWASFIEIAQLAEEKLNYTIGKAEDAKKMTPLQQLWLYLCQRRLWLPTISVRLKRSGVQKSTKFLRILPKFTVEDIRTFDGKDI